MTLDEMIVELFEILKSPVEDYSFVNVKFQGGKYIWVKNTGRGGGALAYLHHFDSKGEMMPEALFESSFAHILPNGEIWRLGDVIGSKDDLVVEAQ
jgi:hypothetical protein